MADAQASGACYGNIVWVQVPSHLVVDTPCGFKSHLPHKETGNISFPVFFYFLI